MIQTILVIVKQNITNTIWVQLVLNVSNLFNFIAISLIVLQVNDISIDVFQIIAILFIFPINCYINYLHFDALVCQRNCNVIL